MSNHKTVFVKVGSWEADIDENIAPLIEALWSMEIYTLNSCERQSHLNDCVWIQFLDAGMAEQFLDIIAKFSDDPNSMYNRIRSSWADPLDPLSWEFKALVDDYGVDEKVVDDNVEEMFSGQHAFNISISIRFPQSDLKEVTELVLKEWNS